MSITLNTVLALPSLRRATVLAGYEGLGNIVTSISVLEMTTPTDTQKDILSKIEFTGGEVVITAFSDIANDIDAQCVNIRFLSDAGEAGIILYYVGVVMPDIDKRVIALCDELSFPLICMPRNEPGLRYGEVITEVMDAVVRDQIGNTTFAIDLIEQISQMAEHNRTIDNVLRMISDKLRVSLVATDARHDILNVVPWPKSLDIPVDKWIAQLSCQETADVLVDNAPSIWGYRGEVPFSRTNKMLLYAFSESRKIEQFTWKQALDSFKIAMNLWGESHDRVDLSELLKAILQDEPVKTHRLAKLYNMDISSLGDTWILHRLDGVDLIQNLPQIRELSAQYANLDICELYEGDIVILPSGITCLQDSDEWAGALVNYCKETGIPAALTRCIGLKHTYEVRDAYMNNKEFVRDAMTIFPQRSFFSLEEIEFAKQCRLITKEGEKRVAALLELIQPILAWRDGESVIETLAVFLLDKSASIIETANELYVHKNTIKYRLQKASDFIGYRIGAMPHSQKLMNCLAVRRLLSNKQT